MKSKLVLIFEQSFSPDIRIVANNERDLINYLSTEYKFTDIVIDSDNYLSYRDSYKNKELIRLHWVEEI